MNVTAVPSRSDVDAASGRQDNVTTSDDLNIESLLQAAEPRSSNIQPSEIGSNGKKKILFFLLNFFNCLMGVIHCEILMN